MKSTEVKQKVVKLSDFLDRHAASITESIEDNLHPIYNPLNPTGTDDFENKIFFLLRRPLRVQGEVVKCVAKSMYVEDVPKVFIEGEMGTGKTMIALSILYASPEPMRTLVLCPTHLTEKWIRETEATIPDVRVVDLTVSNVLSILQSFRTIRKKPAKHEIYVISKEKAKLSYAWRPALHRSNYGLSFHCPICNEVPMKDNYVLTMPQLSKKKYFCAQCKSALWQADRKFRRYAPAEYIKKYLKGFFNAVIVDEIQDYKAGNTLQGRAMASLLSFIKYTICLTGTLNGGYADDLFHLLFRMDPKDLILDGFKHDSANQFLATYGTLERIRKLEEEDKKLGKGKTNKDMLRKRPGVSPAVVGRYLLNKAVFIRLSDVVDGLPSYEENVLTYRMKGAQADEYHELESHLKEAVKRNGNRALSAKLQALLSYPDSCAAFAEQVVIKDRVGEIADIIQAPIIELSEGVLLPKEEDFLAIVQKEKKEGRKVLCYVTFTGSRDIRPRLDLILRSQRTRVGILDVSIPPKKREAWVKKHAKEFDVLICNAELVKTGLDLFEFPTIYFFQTGYNIFTLRQAARRSWRIGQTKPVRVYFAVYESSMQALAISLIAKKLEVALSVEGDLPEGLAEYSSDVGSILNEMGKALLEGTTYAGAEKAWASFRKRELESQFGLTSKESIFYNPKTGKAFQQTGSETLKVTESRTSINQNKVIVKVSLMEGKKKKRSVVEVTYGDLETFSHGKPIQFALF